MTDALAVNDQPPSSRTRRAYHHRGFGNSVSVNLSHAKVAREKISPAPVARIEAAPIAPPSVAMSRPPDSLATFDSYESMVEAFRIAKDLRGLSNSHCDDLANLATGHSDAILGPTGRKNFGPLSFNALCWAFAIKFIMVVDVEREAEMVVHWADRQRQIPHVREPSRVSKILIERATPYVMSALAKKGWETRRSKARKS